MRILKITPEHRDGSIVARFDAELSPDIRMYRIVLRRRLDGLYSVYAPQSSVSTLSATFSPEFARELTVAAVTALSEMKGQTARENRT